MVTLSWVSTAQQEGGFCRPAGTNVRTPRQAERGAAGRRHTWHLGHPAQLQVIDVGGQREAVCSSEDGHTGAVLCVEDLRLQHVVLQHLLCHGEEGPGLGQQGTAPCCWERHRGCGGKTVPGRTALCRAASSTPAERGRAPVPLGHVPARTQRKSPAGRLGSSQPYWVGIIQGGLAALLQHTNPTLWTSW